MLDKFDRLFRGVLRWGSSALVATLLIGILGLGGGFVGTGGSGCLNNCTLTGVTTLTTLNVIGQYQLNGINKNPLTSLTNTAAPAAVASTNTETYFAIGSTGLLTAGLLNTAGVRMEISLAGIYGTNGATDTIQLNMKLCTVSGCGSGTVVQIATTGVVTPGAGVTNQGWNASIVCITFTTGASGTLDCQGFPGAVFYTALTTSKVDDIVNTGTSTVDLTVAEYVSVSATWNNNSGNNTITLRNFAARIY